MFSVIVRGGCYMNYTLNYVMYSSRLININLNPVCRLNNCSTRIILGV